VIDLQTMQKMMKRPERSIVDTVMTREAVFQRHHAERPQVLVRFCFVALFMAARGDKRISANNIANEMKIRRSEFNLTCGCEPMGFDNNDRPFYARLCLERHPELKGVLSVKGARNQRRASEWA